MQNNLKRIVGRMNDKLSNKDLKLEILTSLLNIKENYGLAGSDTIEAVHLELAPMTPDNGLLSQNWNIIRRSAKFRFFAALKALYNGAILEGEAEAPNDESVQRVVDPQERREYPQLMTGKQV